VRGGSLSAYCDHLPLTVLRSPFTAYHDQKMNIIETTLPGVLLLEPKVFGDPRGFFLESWNRQIFAERGLNMDFVQDNHSRSAKGVLRGLHYQLNDPQGKLVRVTSGAVFDVAVDVRKSSPNFGQWVGYELSADNQRMMWVPPGFAHGFLVLSDTADFLYKTTAYYAPQWDRGIRWDDPEIGVKWPLDGAPTLSPKDQVLPLLKDAEVYA
jgi:dTDP-4-dehydrorhamnose 3,5-epimerase